MNLTFGCLVVFDKLTLRIMINALAVPQKLLLFAVDDGCLENTPDTAEFSREFQLHQHLYDPEHDYPGLGKWVSSITVSSRFYTLVF